MNLVTGDLWDEVGRADLILFTANSSLDRNGHLVMGAGAALEAKRRCPEAPRVFGGVLRAHGLTRYGLLFDCGLMVGTSTLGAFQVKTDFNRQADPELIISSVEALIRVANEWGTRIAMNFPAIGLGGLKREDVLPLLKPLPDNVFVYERGR